MHKWIVWMALLLISFSPIAFATEKALLLDVNGAIGPASQDYIKRGLTLAQEDHASIIILQLNTPGGLDSSMRSINQAIISSPIPVIAYVAPSGARAASAGTFIMYASHLSAMAPGTNIGAAAPINLLGSNQTKELTTEDKKMMNDAIAYIHSLAMLRGRNVSWAESAVRQAASLSAEDAKRLNVINVLANNTKELLEKVDGHTVLVQGALKVIRTKNTQIISDEPDWRYQFLLFITNPNFAYILMLIAIYGLFFELSNPGLVLPGVAGLIALVLVLYAFQLMPINYTGLTLLLIGIAFMIFEVYVSSFGIIGIGGIVAFILGSIMLFDIHNPDYQLAFSLIISMSIISVIFFLMIVGLAIRSHKRAIVTGSEGLINSEGVVISVTTNQIHVQVLGEIWEAQSSSVLEPGMTVKIVKVKGLTLMVEPINR